MRNNLLILLFLSSNISLIAQDQIPISIENYSEGAPITMGLPFPISVLYSPDKVRVLDDKGKEIPSQVTEISTWAPRDNSIKWIWVFFFTNESHDYIIEYGKGVIRANYDGSTIASVNNQRTRGGAEVNTGLLKLKIDKGDGGFLKTVALDVDNNGFSDDDIIAKGKGARGSFLDILDDLGIDKSKAVIHKTYKEKGSGPLHTIIRIEGEYLYTREDNNKAPFTTRIHCYAGKSYIKVLHTIIYTGEPDKHPGYKGDHANIATQNEHVIETYDLNDSSLMQPEDQIAAAGLNLNFNLSQKKIYRTGYSNKEWWEKSSSEVFETSSSNIKRFAVLQTGDNPSRMPPLTTSSPTERIGDFQADISIDKQSKVSTQKGEGWIDISDNKWGISIGIRNYLEEYPKGFEVNSDENVLQAYVWPPGKDAMNFSRESLKPDGQMLDNFAQGLAKTTEITFNFHAADKDLKQLKSELNYFTNPTVAHANPNWYASSLAFGKFSPSEKSFQEYERGLDYKFDWVLYNQKWEPWYGMFDFGDFKTYYYNDQWYQWSNNEPAQDYMLWMQFMRTGNPKYYRAAEATSRHTMDVDNIHWPTYPKYDAASNDAIDYWDFKNEKRGTPYLGIGRRHARQQWTALLSAHVWIQGWISSYYLSGYHRGLEVAKQTGDAYMRRIWGDHGLTGRRLYLSVLNLTELWDATKDVKYKKELDERISRMLSLQNGSNQYNSLVMDRYGYAQVYASQGLSKYHEITGDEQVKNALIKHARAIRDLPPWNHKYESYLSTIHSLLVGYEYSGEVSFLREAIKRSEVLKTDKLSKSIDDFETQGSLGDGLKSVSHLPSDPESRDVRGEANWSIRQGLRVFGWTHAYNVPYLLYWLRKKQDKANNKGGTR